MTDTPKHSVSVAGVVVDERGRVLVIKRRDNGRWEPPGGVLELAETPEAGLKREVLEETGVSVDVKVLTGVYKNLTLGIVNLTFLCAPARLAGVQPTAEASEVEWADFSSAVARMSEAYAVRLTDAFGSSVPVRSHDGLRITSTVAREGQSND